METGNGATMPTVIKKDTGNNPAMAEPTPKGIGTEAAEEIIGTMADGIDFYKLKILIR